MLLHACKFNNSLEMGIDQASVGYSFDNKQLFFTFPNFCWLSHPLTLIRLISIGLLPKISLYLVNPWHRTQAGAVKRGRGGCL
jgi:hypothetical protein